MEHRMARGNTTWDPAQYLRFGQERSRPLVDLLSRVPVPEGPDAVRRVLDLGCGPGNDVPVLRGFFPRAHLLGVDSSAQMIQRAREATTDDPNVSYRQADVRDWLAGGAPADPAEQAPDLIVSNAMFQWVEDHQKLLPGIAEQTGPGGVFALQVPGNFDAPSHVLLRQIAARPEYARHVTEALRDTVVRAEEYLRVLSRPGWAVDAWETTYLHVLPGEDPVFEWISGTGARPVLQALPSPEREDFTVEYKKALREAYPPTEAGTILPFRRIFAVARRV